MLDTPAYTLDERNGWFSKFNVSTWASDDGRAPSEQTRFNYTHATQLFPHAIIPRSGAVASLEMKLDEAVGLLEAQTPLGELSLAAFIEKGGLDGVLIIRRGRVVFESYPGMRPFDCHIWWSVSKPIASLLVAILERRKLIQVDRNIDFYIPELGGSGFSGVSVRDVLDMASGINALETDDPAAHTDPDSPFGRFEASLGIQASTPNTPKSPYQYVRQLHRGREPGRAFEYTSVNTFTLAWLIERVTKLPLNEVIRAELWAKLGAQNDAFLMIAAQNGAPAIHGGISSTLRDLGRFGMLFTPSSERISAQPLVPPELLKRIQTGGRPEIFRQSAIGARLQSILGEAPAHNSYQWDFVMPDGDFFKGGFGGQGLYISPSQDLVMAYFGHNNDAVYAMRYARKLAAFCRASGTDKGG